MIKAHERKFSHVSQSPIERCTQLTGPISRFSSTSHSTVSTQLVIILFTDFSLAVVVSLFGLRFPLMYFVFLFFRLPLERFAPFCSAGILCATSLSIYIQRFREHLYLYIPRSRQFILYLCAAYVYELQLKATWFIIVAAKYANPFGCLAQFHDALYPQLETAVQRWVQCLSYM